tara:strand:+ start:501 stop:893 length:393 start_codon:yes stop_codon:yes gene_type:complete
MKSIKRIILLLWIMMATSASTESAITPEDLPPWLKPELLIHIAAMDMNELQNNEFREGLNECLTGLQRVVQREIRKGGVNIPKRIQRGINRQYNNFDERMKTTLKKPQIEPWTNYLEGLKDVMAERALKK